MNSLNKINVRPDKDRLINLLNDIKKGKLVVPNFQRDYVWSAKQRLELFDSISKGFPIGSLLFWYPENDDFDYNNTIGPYSLNLKNNKYSYIIDGFQRITTLFSALTNPSQNENNLINKETLDSYIVYYNLEEQEFNLVNSQKEAALKPELIPTYILVDTFEFLSYTKTIQEFYDEDTSVKFINRAKKLATALLDYEVAFVNIHGGSIKDAIEIFSRINSKGSDMSPMWMISALTYEEGNDGFKFSDEVENLKIDLDEFNFSKLKTDIILQCIESATGKIYFDVKSESLPKREDFKDLSLNTFQSIKKAVKFLYENVNVVDVKLLPYNLQLIFIAEFFRIVDVPTDQQLLRLEKWFWQTTYSSYFTIYSLSKQRIAFNQFKDFCYEVNKDPLYIADYGKLSTADFPNKIYYGSVRSKALALFLIKNVLDSTELENKDLDDFYSFDRTNKESSLLFPKFKNLDYNSTFDTKKNDFSYILKERVKNFNYQANFISDEIFDKTLELMNDFNFNDFNDFKILRFELIKLSESKFVESIGLHYNNNYYPPLSIIL